MSCRGGKHLSTAPRPARAAPRARLAFGPAAAGGPWAAGGGGPGAERAGPRAGGGRSAARMAPRRPTPPLPAASTAVPPPRAAEGRAAPHGLQVSEAERDPPGSGSSGRAAGAAVGGGWAAGRASLPSPRLVRRLFVCKDSGGRR